MPGNKSERGATKYVPKFSETPFLDRSIRATETRNLDRSVDEALLRDRLRKDVLAKPDQMRRALEDAGRLRAESDQIKRMREIMERTEANRIRAGLDRMAASNARKALRLAGRQIPLVASAEWLKQLWDNLNNLPDDRPAPMGWVQTVVCNPGPLFLPAGITAQPNASCWQAGAFSTWQSDYAVNATLGPTINTVWRLGFQPIPFSIFVGSVAGLVRYERPAGSRTPNPAPGTGPGAYSPWPYLDPNLMRKLPSERPEPQAKAQLEPEPSPSRRPDTRTVLGGLATTGPWIRFTPGERSETEHAPTRRAPPRGRDREKKVITKSKAFAIALFKVLDNVSELSEIVDAFYQALPKEVRHEYEKSLGFHFVKIEGKWKWLPPEKWERSMIDGAGQYGIDGADWKLQGIYKHFDQINPVDAVNGIVGNFLEDRIIGDLQRGLPKNWVNANKQGDEEIGRLINDFFEANPVVR